MAKASDIRAGGAFIELGFLDRDLRRGLAKLKVAMTSVSKQATLVGGKFLRLGAMMAAPLAAGIKLASDFSDQMSFVATMLSGPALQRLPEFTADIRKMSVEFGETTKALSGGLFDILSASVPASKAMEVLRVSVVNAQAGFIDTKTAADALTTVVNSYRLDAMEAASVSDFFFTVVKRGKTTMAELAPTIGQVASIAKASGLSLEEFGAALSTMTRNGVPTAIAVTSLNAILSTFLKPTEDAKKAARALGIELNTETLRTEGLAGVLGKLQGARAEEVSAIFVNKRALKGLVPTLGDYEGFLKDIELQQNRTGATQEAFSKRSENLATQFRKLGQSLKDFFLEIGLALTDDADNALDGILEFIQSTKEWVSENKDLVKSFARLVVHVLALGVALIAFGKGLALALFVFTNPFALAVLAALALLETFGVLDTGFSDLVGNFRVRGRKISTTLATTWIEIKKDWERLKVDWLDIIDRMTFGTGIFAGKSLRAIQRFVGEAINLFFKLAIKSADLIGEDNKLSLALQNQRLDSLRVWAKRVESTSKTITDLTKKRNKDISDRRTKLDETLRKLDEKRKALIVGDLKELEKQTADSATRMESKLREILEGKTGVEGPGAAPAPTAPAGVTLEITAVLEKMEKALKDADAASRELGAGFDLQGQKAIALQEALRALTELGLNEQSAAILRVNELLAENGQSWEDWLGQQTNVLEQFQELSQSVFSQLTQGFGDAIASMLIMGETLSESFGKLMKRLAATVVASLVKIALQWAISSVAAMFSAKTQEAAVVSAKAAETVAGQMAAMSSAPFPINLTAPAVAAGMLGTFKALVSGAKGIFGFAEGGIVTKPMMGLVGEAGPEAIIPLSKLGGGRSQTIIIELDGQELARSTVENMPDVIRVLAGSEF